MERVVWARRPTGQDRAGVGAHIVSQEGNAVGKRLPSGTRLPLASRSTNPVNDVSKVYVAQFPPSILRQPVSHLHEELLTGERQGRGLLSGSSVGLASNPTPSSEGFNP